MSQDHVCVCVCVFDSSHQMLWVWPFLFLPGLRLADTCLYEDTPMQSAWLELIPAPV